MLLFELLVEKKILEAQSRGEFDDLPGIGQPLALDGDPLIPAEVRVTYRVLKNAGFVPPEIEDRCEAQSLERLINVTPDGESRARAMRKLNALRLKISETRGGRAMRIDIAYLEKILDKLS